MAGVYVVGQQLSGHRSPAKSRRCQASDDEQVFVLGDLADERLAIQREGHEPRPGSLHRKLAQQRDNLYRLASVDLDA